VLRAGSIFCFFFAFSADYFRALFLGVINEASYFYDPSLPKARGNFVKVRCLCVAQGHSALARKMFSQLDRSMN
jgi:hypothetical protein